MNKEILIMYLPFIIGSIICFILGIIFAIIGGRKQNKKLENE